MPCMSRWSTGAGLLCLTLPLSATSGLSRYRDLFPGANRMQRAAYDLLGIAPRARTTSASGCATAPGRRTSSRCARDSDGNTVFADQTDGYPFVRVSGDGVHEIPVGPVHAGTIEPGHFRFSVVGETRAAPGRAPGLQAQGHREALREHESGTGRQARRTRFRRQHGGLRLGLRQAVESLTGAPSPPRALWLRALLLERERIANHLGDLGYLGNDVALAFGFAQFWTSRRTGCASTRAVRPPLPDGRIVPGGVACDLDARARSACSPGTHSSARSTRLKDIYDEHAGAQDRFLTTGRVTPELAAQLGSPAWPDAPAAKPGICARQFPGAPYDQLERAHGHPSQRRRGGPGHGALRGNLESLRLIRLILAQLPGRRTAREPCGDAPEQRLRHGLGRRLARRSAGRAAHRRGRRDPSPAIRTTRPGRTGRCWSTRSSATSCRISR